MLQLLRVPGTGTFFLAALLASLTTICRVLSSRRAASVKRNPAKANTTLDTAHDHSPAEDPPGKAGVSLKQLMKQAKIKPSGAGRGEEAGSHHKLYLNTLKGHQDRVNGLGWNASGNLLATACDDRVLRIFTVADLRNRNITFRRKNLTKCPVDVAFGNGPELLIALTRGTLEAASISAYGGSLEQLWELPDAHGGSPAISLACAPGALGSQGVVMSCGAKIDMRVISTSGAALAMVETNGLTNHGASLSRDGRFLAAATFTTDVKVYEVQKKGGRNTHKVMDLKGHKSQVLCVDFSTDSRRAVTASKDGTWCVWNIDVRYHMQEDPKVLLKMQQQVPQGRHYTRIAFGPSGVIAAVYDRTLQFLESSSGQLLGEVEEAHESAITCMEWAPALCQLGEERTAVLATGSTDRKVRLWRSP